MNQHTRISDKESGWRMISYSGILGIGPSCAIYTNIPIVLEDGTVLEPNKAVSLEKLQNVKFTNDLGNKSITFDNYSSFSKTFTMPDWYDVDLRTPAWESINTETNEFCDKFGGDFKMDEVFPSDKLIDNALSLKVGGRDNYKCVATIVHNSNQGRGAGYRTVELEHIFVKKDVDELKGRWSNKEKTGIAFKNLEYVCGNQHTRCSDKESGWTNYNISSVGLGSAIYTNIPIVLDDGTVIEPYFLYGDINDDGVVDIEDTVMLRAYLDDEIELTGRAYKSADVNRDGVVDEKDITDSENHINGKKPINDSNIITNDNDSDSDGLTDLEEYNLGTNRFNPDTDGDYLNDGIDPDPKEKQPIEITDENLNDTFSVLSEDGLKLLGAKRNPDLDSDGYVTDGQLIRIPIDGSSEEKNCYKFIRRTNDDFSFEIKPVKNSDYEITINNATKDNVIFKIEAETIRTVPITYSVKDNGTSVISYRFSLIKDFKYNISINNCNTSYDFFEVKFSQDNWVYAPYGGKATRLSNSSFIKDLPLVSVYLPDDKVKEWLLLQNAETGIENNPYNSVEEGEKIIHGRIVDTMYQKLYGKLGEDNLTSYINTAGSISSIVGLCLLPFGGGTIAIISTASTIVGGGTVIFNFNIENFDEFQEIANNFKDTSDKAASLAIHEHNYSFCISGGIIPNDEYSSFLAANCQYWDNYFINKYDDKGERRDVEVFGKITLGL